MNTELHSICTAEKAARAKILLEESVLRVEKAAQKKRIWKMTRCLAKELSARERSIVEKRHTEDAAAVKYKLIEQVMQLPVSVTELKSELVYVTETLADFNVK